MELSITAVTKNRKFGKALVRHATTIAELERAIEYVDSSEMPFDVFQIIFLDRSEEYLKPVGLKEARLFQVEVAIPSEQNLDYNNSTALLRCLAQRIRAAVEAAGLPEAAKARLVEVTAPFS